jgi:hypothetical protein
MLAWLVQPGVGLSVAGAATAASAPQADWPGVSVTLLLLAVAGALVALTLRPPAGGKRAALPWGIAAVVVSPVVTLLLWASAPVQRLDVALGAWGSALGVQTAFALHAVFFRGLIVQGRLSRAHGRDGRARLLPASDSGDSDAASQQPTARSAADVRLVTEVSASTPVTVSAGVSSGYGDPRALHGRAADFAPWMGAMSEASRDGGGHAGGNVQPHPPRGVAWESGMGGDGGGGGGADVGAVHGGGRGGVRVPGDAVPAVLQHRQARYADGATHRSPAAAVAAVDEGLVGSVGDSAASGVE